MRKITAKLITFAILPYLLFAGQRLSATEVSENRKMAVDILVKKGYLKEDAKKVIDKSSNESVANIVKHPELVQENGIIFCIAFLIVMIKVIDYFAKAVDKDYRPFDRDDY